MWKVLFFSWFAMLALMALLMRARYLMEAARGELEMVRHEAEADMKNLNSIFAAYLIAWGIFFAYYLSVARRAAALHEDIERLKNSLHRGK